MSSDFCKQMVATTPICIVVLDSRTLRVKLSNVNWTCVDIDYKNAALG